MMQSIALGDSHYVDTDDYILVQQPEQMIVDFGDDESYDCCEDLYSVITAEQSSLTVCSEEPGGHFEEDLVLTVTSFLMKDLDDAHAAATLVEILDSEQRSDAGTFSCDQQCPKNGKDIEVRESLVTDGEHMDSATSGEQPSKTEVRTSNKKRRKLLKLRKKAVAAATAVQTLSERARAAATASATKSKKKSIGGRPSKKIANIAVACATETLSSYQQELLANKIKPLRE
jgi:hypothetical protein